MARPNLRGMGVALITPFRADKSIDFDALARLLDYQIKSGIDYLVVLGTTAETPALTPDERVAVRDFVAQRVGGRIPLVLGCGGNCTAAVCAELANVPDDYSAVLSVVPYYNKPSQEGIYRHYEAIAAASHLPIVLYNVPGRTGVNMTAETTLRLANDFPDKIIAIKEASGNFSQIDDIIKHKPEEFMVISGDDGITYPLICLGAVGVISVVGNAFPREFSRMVRLALEGDYDRARLIHHRFTDLFSLLFVDGNPAGVKCALHAMGYIENELRLPLVPTRITTYERIRQVLDSLN